MKVVSIKMAKMMFSVVLCRIQKMFIRISVEYTNICIYACLNDDSTYALYLI